MKSTFPTLPAAARTAAAALSLAAAALVVQAQTPAAPAAASAAASAPAAAECPALLQNQTFPRLQDDKPQALCQYAGKVLLVVNTASKCGFTPQYEGLEALHAKYASQGLVVLGFPSNDFQQELGTSQEIADFCFNTYGVKFPMFGKTRVKGAQANAFYQSLAKASGRAPAWNFHKYLIDRRGVVVGSYASSVTPDHPELLGDIENALSAK